MQERFGTAADRSSESTLRSLRRPPHFRSGGYNREEQVAPKDRKWFDGLVCGVGHVLWKQRNAWCFGNIGNPCTPAVLFAKILSKCQLLRRLHTVGEEVFGNG
jgi:hypothetical protein